MKRRDKYVIAVVNFILRLASRRYREIVKVLIARGVDYYDSGAGGSRESNRHEGCPHVPKKAVGILARKRYRREDIIPLDQKDFAIRAREMREANEDLQAALPTLYAQRDKEWRERLMSEEAGEASRAGIHWRSDGEIESIEIPTMLKAAIAAAFPEVPNE